MPKEPAPEIALTISNGSDQSHPAILLRKFFAMVFIEPGGKKLNIFIATVFGGVADEGKEREGFPLVNYSEQPNSSCFLRFDFQSSILAKNGFHVEDVTESFCRQTKEISCVWCNPGEQGITEYTTETDVAAKLKKLYPDLYQQKEVKITLGPGLRSKVYEIKKGDASTHHCVAIPGEYTPPREGESNYSLSMPLKVDGLEAINWIKTELTLTKNILDHRMHFCVKLGVNQKFYTPDFTWYIAPPPGSAVDENTATLTFGNQGNAILNNIQNVRDDTTVRFQEWLDLDIEDRRKARVQPKLLDQWQSPFMYLSQAGQLSVSFETFDPEKESNRQFMIGLVVAFILSFCSDKTRINDYYDCLQRICQCTSEGGVCWCRNFCNGISILAPFVVLLTFYVYAYDPRKCLPPSWKDRHPRWWRCLRFLRDTAFGTFGFLALYIFGVWPVAADIMGRFISCGTNCIIICAVFGLNLIFSAMHIGIMRFRLKRSPKY